MRKKVRTLGMIGALIGILVTGCEVPHKEKVEAVQATNQVKADEVATLIDKIYVQQRNQETDAQCEAAKVAWDALTPEQRELVVGEYADADYFGRDTGDASLDNPLNQDNIGEKEILVVSFGTSFNESRVADIKSIEEAMQKANPDWAVRRAFTSQIIINHVQARDGEKIDNVEQALDRAVRNGVKQLIIQPTHLMHGAEYDELIESVTVYKDSFEQIILAEPLLGASDAQATALNEDKAIVAKAIVDEAISQAGYEHLAAAEKDGVALVLMGHGTSHTAKVTYTQMQEQVAVLGYTNVFIGTVEGEPEDTACQVIIEKIKEAGYTQVILRPLMVVAGDHAHNDMASEEESSWKSQFVASGYFQKVDTQIEGLGRIKAIKDLYIAHTASAMTNQGQEIVEVSKKALADGKYLAKFTSDSKMLRLNEASEGRGVLTVKDGKMLFHMSMPSKNILNLFVGLAKDAEKSNAKVLNPITETVTYSDGMVEEVFAFDVPILSLDETFDLALIGKKGTWYDHKVSVSDPVKIP